MKTTPILHDHFERLKELLPDIYSRPLSVEKAEESDHLFNLLKRTLRIIEAVYLQDREMFHSARTEEYGRVISELRTLGYEYRGNEELIAKAANQLIMSAKKPMEKAQGATRKGTSDIGRKAM